MMFVSNGLRPSDPLGFHPRPQHIFETAKNGAFQ
ncbi:hypothetical protein PSJ8397_00577 [Pseudooctadecabacter jejudonensis]|uniref:Uncharacterized protein n=1 Tax=Pseudooctadecabacter jejudonensis TaxID=1391910 RepID=A0A1Y5RI95_9RHOB|nr:hypothetical protein PSJ8397_00577 [Pseudooctadecabacter jejudonensis]